MTTFDREAIFQWVYEKNWLELLKFVHSNRQAASADPIIQTAMDTFIQQFVAEVGEGNQINDLDTYLTQLFVMHKTKIFVLSEEHLQVVVVELVKRSQDRVEEAYRYAKSAPSHEVCAEAIRRYEDARPKVVEHSQSGAVRVTQNRNIANDDHTITLFKSQQEYQFFRAVIAVFPNSAVYPNVALSCLVDFAAIERDLTSEERSFFFRGIVDCVVFDIYRGHKPTYFFELDSAYHDTKEQQVKDGYKDHILSLAGQKLYRVRKTFQGINEDGFISLIREVLEKDVP